MYRGEGRSTLTARDALAHAGRRVGAEATPAPQPGTDGRTRHSRVSNGGLCIIYSLNQRKNTFCGAGRPGSQEDTGVGWGETWRKRALLPLPPAGTPPSPAVGLPGDGAAGWLSVCLPLYPCTPGEGSLAAGGWEPRSSGAPAGAGSVAMGSSALSLFLLASWSWCRRATSAFRFSRSFWLRIRVGMEVALRGVLGAPPASRLSCGIS